MAYSTGVGCFLVEKERWENYIIRFEAWATMNDIRGNDRKWALIAEIGADTFSILKDLAFPMSMDDSSYDQLKALLDGHFKNNNRPTAMAVRLQLHNRKQLVSETISQYIVALKQLSANCEFGVTLEERLRDTFTFGLKNNKIVKRLLEESQKPNYSWTKATTLALSMETIDSDVNELEKPAASQVNRLGGSRRPRYASHQPRRGTNSSNASATSCYRCGGTNHLPEVCRYREEKCFNCNKKGHTKKVCRNNSSRGGHYGPSQSNSRGGKTYGRANYMEDESNEAFNNLFHIDSSKPLPAEYHETLHVENVPISFVVDTACPVTVVPETYYTSHFSHLKLEEADLHLNGYSGHGVPVLGSVQVNVRYGNGNYRLPMYVVKGDNAKLLGRQWLENIKLDWRKIYAVRSSGSVEQLITSFSDVFSGELGTIKHFKAEIVVDGGAAPLFHRPRPIPYALKDQVSAELDKLEASGVISKIDRSDWAAPLVVVPKADGSLRICGDYKVTVNQVVKAEPYPLPTAEDLFSTLADGSLFTKLDLSQAYLQCELTEESKKYLVVNTHKGLYVYHRLSYGVSTAPNLFQKIMDQVLQGLPGVVCYLDDILIASQPADHMTRVMQVLERLRLHGIQVKKSKCAFMTNSVTYLGHVISADGIRPTSDKVKAIRELKQPNDVHQLRVLLGLVNYYAKFIPNQATLLSPWYKLLQQNTKFNWNKECEKVLNQVKEKLTSDRLLVHYDPHKQITLACDASPVGVGCVLSHVINGQERPIAYASRSLTASEKNYCQLEREGLAIVYGLVKFHKYIYGRKFTIITDNKPISKILGPKEGIPSLAAARLQRWSMILMAHQYELQFRSSQQHGNCDGLSRFPVDNDELGTECSVNHFSVSNTLPITARQIAEETRKNPTMIKAYEYTMNGWPSWCNEGELKPYFVRSHQLSADQGCLLWGTRVIIPPKYRSQLLAELHEDHPGIVKMKSRARTYLWFPGLDSEIETLVSSCGVCQSIQKDVPPPPLIPWDFPSGVWKRVHVDFAEFEKRNYLIVVDSHSKWMDAIEMNTTTTAKTITELRRLFAMFGVPELLVSDNGPQFTSYEFKQFLEGNGVRHSKSAPYHPATNGAAERSVQTIKNALKKHLLSAKSSTACGKDISQALQSFLLTYRTTPHTTTGRSPAEIFLKRQPRTRLSLLKPNLASSVQQKQEAQKESHDKFSKFPAEFSVGEIVRVKNHRQGLERFVKGVIAKKIGPYKFLVKIGSRCRYVHIEHLRKTGELYKDNYNDMSDHSDENVSISATHELPIVQPEVNREIEVERDVTIERQLPPHESLLPTEQNTPERKENNTTGRQDIAPNQQGKEVAPSTPVRRSTRERHLPLALQKDFVMG